VISVSNLVMEFGGEPLFKGISFHIGNKERIGLAGKNGAGKTTLLRIIKGEQTPTGGEVIVPENETIGYLPQEKQVKSTLSVLDETLSAFAFLNDLQKELETIHRQLSSRTDYQSKSYIRLYDRQEEIHHLLAVNESGKQEGQAIKVLKGLGFRENELQNPVNSFSLGWQMRMELAKLLLLQPTLLLLDEPTNHLDIDAIQWLENFLKSYKGSVLLVSHDRSFLDNLTTRTLEINNGKIYDFKVPYSQYLILSRQRIEQQQAVFSNQQKQIKEIEDFIERFRYKATKARQVQSRIKQLEKMEKAEVDERDNAAVHFRFPPVPRSGKVVVEGRDVSKTYGDKKIFGPLNFQVIRGEKIVFTGRNGEGKTTLAKIIAGNLAYEGEIKYGHNVKIAYYAQDQWEMLNPAKTVFETVDDIAVGDIRTRLKSILGAFLFQGDDINKRIRVLSGGEKARLSLARLLLSPSNLLILDEPTNHLDLITKDILKNALLQYEGTLILVSHDRDFLQGLSEHFFELRNGQLKEFRGTLNDYLTKRSRELQQEDTEKPIPEKPPVKPQKQEWQQRKEKERRLRKLRKILEETESLIEKTESELSQINEKLSQPDAYAEEIKDGRLYKKHNETQQTLDALYARWEELQLKLETE
jgi:ATP-binding cassette subfamily F protein 3